MPPRVKGEERLKKRRMAQMKKELALPEPKKSLKMLPPGDRDTVRVGEADTGEVQRVLTKRNLILRQLKGINDRVQQILGSVESMDDESHLVQFQVYKDQLKRLIARYEETAKEREKVLINVNIIFQKELSLILEKPSASASLSDIPKDLLRDVREHTFCFDLSSSSKAVKQLGIASDRLISCVKDMLTNKEQLQLQASVVPDALLQGRHERMMQEMTDKALENIKLSNALSQQEQELMRLRAAFSTLRSQGKVESHLGLLQADLDKACDGVIGMHTCIEESLYEPTDNVKLPQLVGSGDEESGQAGTAEDKGRSKDMGVNQRGDTVSQFKGLHHEEDRPAHFKDRGLFKQGERLTQYKESSLACQTVVQLQSGPLDYRERGVHHQGEKTAQFSDGGLLEQGERSAQLKDAGVIEQGERLAQLKDAGLFEQGERSAQLKDAGLFEQGERSAQLECSGVFQQVERTTQLSDRDTSTRKMLHELSEDYDHFNKLSVSLGKKMLIAAPEQTKETQDTIENIKKCSVKEKLPADLANAGGFVNTIRKAATNTATEIKTLTQEVIAESDNHISALATDRFLQPEVRKARKAKYNRCKERARKLSSCFTDCYKQMMDNIDSIDTRLHMDTSSQRHRHTDRLQELDQMVTTSSLCQIMETDGNGEERDKDTTQRYDRTTTTATQHLAGPTREAAVALPWQKGTMFVKAPASESRWQNDDRGGTQLPHIVPPRDVQCDTRLKKSMLQLQRMASLTEQDSLSEWSSILPKLPTVDTSVPKQTFSQHKTKPVEASGNFHPRTKASSEFKTHYVPAFSSFQGYQRSILRAKQKREMKEGGKRKQGAGKSYKALVCR